MKYLVKNVWLLLAIMLPLCFTACSDEGKEDFSTVPGIENESWSGVVTCKPEGETMNFTFKARSSWVVNKSANWALVTPTSGKKGNSQVSVTLEENQENTSRTASITFIVEGYKSVTLSITQEPNPKAFTASTEMNPTIDSVLEKYYLWNDDYKKMNRDLHIPYVDYYDNFLRNTLLSMTTNTLDKKPISGSSDYNLYSYVERLPKGRSRSVQAYGGVNHGVEKEKINTFGISRVIALSFVDTSGKPTGNYGFAVSSVYPGSTADALGVKRGTIIYKINDQDITANNYVSLYLNMVSPTQNTLKINASLVLGQTPIDLTLDVCEIEPSPVLKQTVIEESGHKIGYLAYDAFDAAYDDDVLEAFSKLKQEGVTDLVLDLRYNGGGHVISSMMLAGCVAGDKCKGQIYQYYRYNTARMTNVESTKKETGNGYDSDAKYFYSTFMYDNYYGVDLSSYALGLNKAYVLVTSSTASSSEACVLVLRGLGLDVTLIGDEHTNGKNVGMEAKNFELGDYKYEVVPISFQYYNCEKNTVPSDGFKVDYQVADWNSGFVDFGEKHEPMLAKAIELITGNAASSRSAMQAGNVQAKTLPMPRVKRHLQGAIVLDQE